MKPECPWNHLPVRHPQTITTLKMLAREYYINELRRVYKPRLRRWSRDVVLELIELAVLVYDAQANGYVVTDPRLSDTTIENLHAFKAEWERTKDELRSTYTKRFTNLVEEGW